MGRIYLDHAATTPMHPEVIEYMAQLMREQYGNPSSIHAEGRRGRAIVEAARKVVARYMNASIGEIFFTSGGTEANNMALQCAVRDLGIRRIISSPVEHHCVLHTLDHLGVEVVMAPLGPDGRVLHEGLADVLDESDAPTLVSLMHVNNELGVVHDLGALSELCAEKGALFHSDTVQGIGHYAYDLSRMKLQFATAAAHKFRGPKGVGFIYINSDRLVRPLVYGGAQERNMRAGTENVAGIAGMARALELAMASREEQVSRLRELNDYMRRSLRAAVPGCRINAAPDAWQDPKILSVSFPANDRSDLLVFNLDIAGVAVSGGSACASGVESESHVLQSLGLSEGYRTVRFSFSAENSFAELDRVVDILVKNV